MSLTGALASIPVHEWDACRRCHDQCVSACPVFRVTGETRHYPSRLAQTAMELVQRPQTTWPSDALALFYGGCVLCGLCEAQCVYQGEPKNAYEIALAMRETLASIHDVRSLYQKERSTLLSGGDVAEGFDKLLLRVDGVEIVHPVKSGSDAEAAKRGENHVLVLVDPYSAAWMAEGVAAFVKLLQAKGKRVSVVGRPLELGGLFWQEGLVQEADQELHKGQALLRSLGFHAAVVTLPSDAWFWRRKAGRTDLRVMTTVEALSWSHGEAHRDGTGLSRSLPRVAVQDSSVMSRCLKQRAQLERLLDGKAEVIPEPGMVGEKRTAQPVAYEGVPVLLSETVRKGIVNSRLDQLKAMKPERVITMDPFSHKTLVDHGIGDRSVPVTTLFEFLWEQREAD